MILQKKTKKLLLFFPFLLSQHLIANSSTSTPIKHIVIIYQENRAFDHYFGTYPVAQNKPGETPFTAKKNTPSVNGFNSALLTNNQNLIQPFRLPPSYPNSQKPEQDYTELQKAYHRGAMDLFVEIDAGSDPFPGIAMGYFDGNTVTGLWNYAQSFALSDNFRSTNIGESTPGAINLISGQTHGAPEPDIPPYVIEGTIIDDINPKYDQCSTSPVVELAGINIGHLLNAKGITWGWFQGGFANCSATSLGPFGPVLDYAPHRNPFQFYKSTSNPNHLPPSSIQMIGKTDQANHLYDLSDFWLALENGILPAISFLKASEYQSSHPDLSNPLLEQTFLTSTINKLQTYKSFWKDMAIIIAYDDCGGFYDHEPPILINDSQLPDYDYYTAPGKAGDNPPLGGYQGRPGYGARLPLLMISPWAKENFVDHTLTDQSSILRFIEDNWSLGRIGDYSFDSFSGSLMNLFDFKKRKLRYLFLNPSTGAIEYRSHS